MIEQQMTKNQIVREVAEAAKAQGQVITMRPELILGFVDALERKDALLAEAVNAMEKSTTNPLPVSINGLQDLAARCRAESGQSKPDAKPD